MSAPPLLRLQYDLLEKWPLPVPDQPELFTALHQAMARFDDPHAADDSLEGLAAHLGGMLHIEQEYSPESRLDDGDVPTLARDLSRLNLLRREREGCLHLLGPWQ
jgi:hypothetical protein